MNKKLMAVAVAGALVAPAVAFAQASTVQVYGTIIVNYNWLNQGNHRVETDMINAHDSGLGFKGEENLGGGLSAWFQCESTMDVTGQSSANTGTVTGSVSSAPATSWCGRNSAVGLKGAFGNIFFGNWDAASKIAMGGFRPFSTSGAYGMGSQLWNGSASNATNTSNVSGFSRRQANLISYATPAMSGFQGNVSVSAANEATALTVGATITKARLYSVGATYTNGPFAAGLGYEVHKDYNPAAAAAYTGGNDRNLNLAAAFTIAGKYKISAIYSDMKYETTATTDLKQKSWGIYGDLALAGPHKVRLGYTVAGSTSGTGATVGSLQGNAGAGNTGSKLYAVQYAYAMSKRTELNAGYAKLNNESAAKYTLQSLGTGTLGQNQSAWVLGVKHTF